MPTLAERGVEVPACWALGVKRDPAARHLDHLPRDGVDAVHGERRRPTVGRLKGRGVVCPRLRLRNVPVHDAVHKFRPAVERRRAIDQVAVEVSDPDLRQRAALLHETPLGALERDIGELDEFVVHRPGGERAMQRSTHVVATNKRDVPEVLLHLPKKLVAQTRVPRPGNGIPQPARDNRLVAVPCHVWVSWVVVPAGCLGRQRPQEAKRLVHASRDDAPAFILDVPNLSAVPRL
mmetsp:Transcript_52203/g.117256  ORF Transcript_52203/g.117256 Transcript_52203/m.117256 type:complete len:235 (-) Transcript_52203:67-771(-)